MSFLVEKANYNDLELLIKFNEEAFPARSFTKEFLEYRLQNDENENPRALFYVVKKNDEIIAQRVALQEDLILNNQIYEAYWGTDFYVKSEYRGEGIGGKIIKKMQEELPILSTTNTGKINASMHEKLGYKVLGSLNLYFKPLKHVKFLKFLTNLALKKEIENSTFAKQIEFPEKANNHLLMKDNLKLFSSESKQSKNVIKGNRSAEYAKWRFFYKENKYYFYSANGLSYYAVRPINWKGMNCLMVADMRHDLQNYELMNDVLDSIILLGKQMNFDGILISSSVLAMQNQIKRKKFINYSKNSIISNFPFLQNNPEIMMHFADSDLDFNYSNTDFVFG